MSKPSSSDTPGSSSPAGGNSDVTSTSNSKETSPPNADVEMKNMAPEGSKGLLPVEEDIMQLARMGEIGAMQKLFTAKKFTANHRDEEGITPLHVRALPPPPSLVMILGARIWC